MATKMSLSSSMQERVDRFPGRWGEEGMEMIQSALPTDHIICEGEEEEKEMIQSGVEYVEGGRSAWDYFFPTVEPDHIICEGEGEEKEMIQSGVEYVEGGRSAWDYFFPTVEPDLIPLNNTDYVVGIGATQESKGVIIKVVQIFVWVYQNDKTWRIIGLVSSVVGLLCCALSPSFSRLIKGWNAFKIFLYGVLSLAIFITIILARQQSSHPKMYVLQRVVGFVVFLLIAVCTIYYDKAVNDKPEILSVVSNAAFALMSLCLSKLTKFRQEMGVFTAFLACFAIQLWTINWMLISVAVVYGFPLFLMHSSPDSRHARGS